MKKHLVGFLLSLFSFAQAATFPVEEPTKWTSSYGVFNTLQECIDSANTVVNGEILCTPSPVVVKVFNVPVYTGSFYTTEKIQPTSELPAPSNIGAFRTACQFTHMAPDDPIVYPKQSGKSHLHTFFCNPDVNAYTTPDNIRDGGRSNAVGGTVNMSGYWVPSMMDSSGNPIKPLSASLYYKTGYNGVKPADVQPFPKGLVIISGNMHNTDPTKVWPSGRWKCIGLGSESLVGPTIQPCPQGSKLYQEIFFPQCWDGINLDSVDHKSHMKFARGGCPVSHPVALPEISFNIIYDVPSTGTKGWHLSSDHDLNFPGTSTHGDWMFGWKLDIMETWVKNCLQKSVDCHSHLLGDGRKVTN
jgi:hypothetical protein